MRDHIAVVAKAITILIPIIKLTSFGFVLYSSATMPDVKSVGIAASKIATLVVFPFKLNMIAMMNTNAGANNNL